MVVFSECVKWQVLRLLLTNCSQVAAVRGINVYQAPSTDRESVGVVANGRRVTIERIGTDGLVPIIVPLRGYVQAENLAYCS